MQYRLIVKRIKTRVLVIQQSRGFHKGGTFRKWQDIDRTWLTVDQVYETRWDCR